jgi:MFS superfamily sulfate permease-like transporter
MLLIIVFLLPVFSFMPMPVIASILITMACRLLPSNYIDEISSLDKFELFILLLTTLLSVTIDGASGLIICGLICLIKYAFNQSNPSYLYKLDQLNGDSLLIVKV